MTLPKFLPLLHWEAAGDSVQGQGRFPTSGQLLSVAWILHMGQASIHTGQKAENWYSITPIDASGSRLIFSLSNREGALATSGYFASHSFDGYSG